MDNYAQVGFRPALEIPADTRNTDFHAVTLNMNGGKMTVHKDYETCAQGDSFSEPKPIAALNIVV